MHPVEIAIEALKQGKMILITDHHDRENEADLVFPAETICPEVINFMIRQGTGIVCVSLLPERLKQLDLPLMLDPENNHSRYGTAFTVSVDAREGITTGVSANDRTRTIQVIMDEQASIHDLVKPGHVYPLKARSGGVLERSGHTEAAFDIVRLAGFKPAAVLCEVMNSDGTMARGEAVKAFAAHHQLALLSIDELVHYRLMHEDQLGETATTTVFLTQHGEFNLSVIKEKYFPYEHVVLFKPPLDPNKPPLVRIHSACATGDIFYSTHCDCHDQLYYALTRISQEGGYLIYLDQEGRGIGLFNKIKAYALQTQGLDTVEANEHLGLPADSRQYYIAAHILRKEKVPSIRLLTNNPAKIDSLTHYGYSSIMREAMPTFSRKDNQHYLLTKKQKLAHELTL